MINSISQNKSADGQSVKRKIILSRMARLGLSAALVSGLVACAADEQFGEPMPVYTGEGSDDVHGVVVEDSDALTQVARLDFPNRSSLRFYEMEGGGVLTIESGSMENGPLTTGEAQSRSPVEFYEQMSGEAAPKALVDAVARGHAAGKARPAIPAVEEVISEPAPASTLLADARAAAQAITWNPVPRTDRNSSEYVGTFCSTLGDRNAAWTSRTGDSSFVWSSMQNFRSSAFAVSGQIRWGAWYKPLYSWSRLVTISLTTGQYMSGWLYVEGTTNVSAAVTEATGNTYHFCSSGWEYQ